MSEFLYEYRIADFIWRCRLPQALTITDESRDFIRGIEKEEEPFSSDFINYVTFEKADQIESAPADAYYTDQCYFKTIGKDKVVYRSFSPNDTTIARITFKPDGDVSGLFCGEGLSRLRYSFGLLNTLSIEYLLLAHSALMLHSCLVRYHNEAILFSASSGIGKSTQGDLWVRYRGAEVLDGDRSGLYQKNGQWRATGLPFAGSSRIYRNENAPIRAIVYLAQGPDNQIRRLTGAEAFRLLYPQIHVHHWEADCVARASDLLISLLSSVPVYYLSCTPDERAVETLEKQLFSE